MGRKICRIIFSLFIGFVAILTWCFCLYDLVEIEASLCLSLFLLIPIVLLERTSLPVVLRHMLFFLPVAVLLGLGIFFLYLEERTIARGGHCERASGFIFFVSELYLVGSFASYVSYVLTSFLCGRKGVRNEDELKTPDELTG